MYYSVLCITVAIVPQNLPSSDSQSDKSGLHIYAYDSDYKHNILSEA